VLNDPLVLAFSSLSSSPTVHQQPADAGADSLPPQVHLLTAKWLSCDVVLVRFSHMFQAGEHPTLSQPASVHLAVVAKLLRLPVAAVQEATLWGERALADSDDKRPDYQFSSNITEWQPPLAAPPAGLSLLSNRLVGPIPQNTRITLNPMQIRTFYVTVQRNSSSNRGRCVDPPESSRSVNYATPFDSAATGEAEISVLDSIAASVLYVQRAPTAPVSISHASALAPGVLLAYVLVPACVAAAILSCLIGRMCCAFWGFDVLRVDKWRAVVRKRAATLY
jgi:alpha-mannosidase